jgi:hypothetical protein
MTGWRVAAAIVMFVAAGSAAAEPCSAPTGTDGYELLDQGYRALYNLDFDGAENAFVSWEMLEPRNPLGPASRASGDLFREFDRLGVLRSELFTNDKSFESRSKLRPDPQLKLRFQEEISLADRLASDMLAGDPSSPDGLLAKTLVNGLQADYAAFIEKRNTEALSYTKESRRWGERLLGADASCYDAFLASGVENYLVSIKPMVVRWLARLGGARADRERGIMQLSLTAQNGRFFKPFAKLLLAVAALRDHDALMARMLLTELQQEFPQNPLYSYELSRLKNAEPIPQGANDE